MFSFMRSVIDTYNNLSEFKRNTKINIRIQLAYCRPYFMCLFQISAFIYLLRFYLIRYQEFCEIVMKLCSMQDSHKYKKKRMRIISELMFPKAKKI